MVTFENELIGLDKNNTVNAYYMRDITMNINNSGQIVQSLKKLCYYEINEKIEDEAYIKSKLVSWIKQNSYSNIASMYLSDFIFDTRNSSDFLQFKVRQSQRIQRSNDLNLHKDDKDTYNFYSSLTLEELNSLGY